MASDDIDPYDLYAESEEEFYRSLGIGITDLPQPHVDASFIRRSTVPSNHCLSNKEMRRLRDSSKKETAGESWFNMSSKEMTEELKLDLLALNYGRKIHPKRFYKRDKDKGLPRFFQVGRIVDKRSNLDTTAPGSRRASKKSFLEQLTEDEKLRKYLRKSYHQHKQREMKKKESLRRGVRSRHKPQDKRKKLLK